MRVFKTPLASVASIAAGANLRGAEIDLGGGDARLRVDIVESVDVDGGVAPRRRRRAALVRSRICKLQPLEIEVELDQRLAGEIDRGPAVERAIAEQAGEAVDHHDIAVEPHFRLARHRRRKQPGGIDVELGRNVLPLHRRRRRGRLDLEFERMLAGAGVAGNLDLAVGRHREVGVHAFDAVLNAVTQIREYNGAAGDDHVLDREGLTAANRFGRRGLARRVRAAAASSAPGARSPVR